MGKKKSRHHRRSKFHGGTDDPSNISWVSDKRHKAFHILWSGEKTVDQIALELSKVWIDPHFELKVVRIKNEIDPNQLEIPFED